jgi:hypothetical protein
MLYAFLNRWWFSRQATRDPMSIRNQEGTLVSLVLLDRLAFPDSTLAFFRFTRNKIEPQLGKAFKALSFFRPCTEPESDPYPPQTLSSSHGNSEGSLRAAVDGFLSARQILSW